MLEVKLIKLLKAMVIKANKNLITNLFQDESGQGMVEYLLILSACVVGASALAKKIIQSLDQAVLRLGGELEKDLKTGRAPLSVWEN